MPDTENETPLPLAGVRGVVMTQVWAGPYCTELFALMGAEIIQIESRQRVDPTRGGSWDAPFPGTMGERPTARHPWNAHRFNSLNLNKKGITLDLSRPKGRELLMGLLLHADFFAENYSPRVMINFGLTYEKLRSVKQNLIVLNLGGFGHSGLYWNTLATGGQIEPMAGMTELIGFEGGEPLGSGALWCDPVSGINAAAALLFALHHRDRTGEGQQIDVSMQEANASFIADALLEYSLNGRVRRRLGNHHLSQAPHNIYACRDGGWLALAVRDEDEWQQLCDAAGHGEWAADARFTIMADRKRNEAALDGLIGSWTREQDALTLEEKLSAAHVPAAKVRSHAEFRVLEHLRERGWIQTVTAPEAGDLDYLLAPFHLSRTPARILSPSPLHGEHSWDVLHEYLGISREEYEQLESDGITGSGPPKAWTPGSRIGSSTPPRGAAR